MVVHYVLDAVVQSKYSIEILNQAIVVSCHSGYQCNSTISDGMNEYWERS